jgi:hypothetical protein
MDLSNFAQIDSAAYFPEGANLSEAFHGIINQFHFVEICTINHGDERYHTAHYVKFAEGCYDPADVHHTEKESESFYRLDTETQCREFLGVITAAWIFDLAV